jgi:hypothetical protein
MNEFDELDPLTEENEEYQMLIDVTEEFPKQNVGSAMQKSGKATIIVVRKHLLKEGLKIAELDARIPEKGEMNLLFILKAGIPAKLDYSLDEVDKVLKVTNTAVTKAASEPIRSKFEELRKLNRNLRFAVVVLSERLSFEHPINIGDTGKVFTLVARKKRSYKLYLKETVMEMQKDGGLRKPKENGWDDLKEYLIRGK